MTNVVNFAPQINGQAGDSIDFALSAFSFLLRDTDPGAGPILGDAIFSNALQLGGTVTINDANVLVFDEELQFDNAAELAALLGAEATALHFGALQIDDFNHYLIAYEDTSGFVRIADLNIQSDADFLRTDQGDTLAISDMVRLVGVSMEQLQSGNIQFV
jgi:hypothetical protein